MSDRPTPETDAAEFYYDGKTGFVEIDFCRKLERERGEAREELARIESLLLDPHAVYLNFLHGKIAKLGWEKLEHIHGPHPARRAPAWIPVSQALPDDDAAVLLHMDDGEIWTGYLDAGAWRYVSGDRIDATVLHWRPFPDPPQA